MKRQGKFIIGYTGAHGQANSLKCIIDAVSTLEKENVALVLIGSGQEKDRLQKYVIDNEITNVCFISPQPKELIPVCLNQMDVLYIGLQRQSLFRFGISPNKMFDYMMAAKPIIQAIEAGNNLVKEADCGVYAEPENVEAIAQAVLKLKAASSEEREKLGKNGYEYVLKYHSYDVLTERYLNILTNLVKS